MCFPLWPGHSILCQNLSLGSIVVTRGKQLVFILENKIKNKIVLITKSRDLTSDSLFPCYFCCLHVVTSYLLLLLSKKTCQ